MAVSCRPVRPKPKHHACMLDRSVLVVELRTDRSHILSLGIHQQLFDPVRRYDTRVVIQKKYIFALRLRNAQIVDF